MLYDDSSIDNSHIEIQPWIKTGFVTILTTTNFSHIYNNIKQDGNHFNKKMIMKNALERHCKLHAIKHAYDYYISLDIDEYIVPVRYIY